jgi:uncharacterized protein YjiS (DUF1127 family)
MQIRMAEPPATAFSRGASLPISRPCCIAPNRGGSRKIEGRVNTMTILRIANDVAQSWNRYRTYREAVRQLASLDDRQLSDIGVDRSRISDVVRGGRF